VAFYDFVDGLVGDRREVTYENEISSRNFTHVGFLLSGVVQYLL
jgi:hypothetical protein